MNDTINNVGAAIPIVVKPDPSFAKFIDVNGQGRNEASEDSFYCINGNTPDPEKPKYMVDAESIEIIAHLMKALFPPFKMVLFHLFPVVGGKAPVLSFDGEIIRWRA